MAYKKPQIVAKSAAKQSFVAGCPANGDNGSKINCWVNRVCEINRVK